MQPIHIVIAIVLGVVLAASAALTRHELLKSAREEAQITTKQIEWAQHVRERLEQAKRDRLAQIERDRLEQERLAAEKRKKDRIENKQIVESDNEAPPNLAPPFYPPLKQRCTLSNPQKALEDAIKARDAGDVPRAERLLEDVAPCGTSYALKAAEALDPAKAIGRSRTASDARKALRFYFHAATGGELAAVAADLRTLREHGTVAGEPGLRNQIDELVTYVTGARRQ
ncbi:MAG: hypothetical protein HC897_01900 [Thermoanaerobaculia bacterium]|nr:hypothetical protein [Thermoanaerobaculia bacterium]